LYRDWAKLLAMVEVRTPFPFLFGDSSPDSDQTSNGHGTRTVVLGHRGVMRYENTLRGFGDALAHGLDGVELDLMLSADHEVVVFHDDDLKRLAGRRDLVASTPWHELERITLRCGERIPLLRDLLATWPREKALNLELKSGGPALVEALAPILRDSCESGRLRAQQVVFSSFDPRLLEAAAQRMPEFMRAMLLEKDSPSWLHADLGRSYGVAGVHLAASLFSPNTIERLRDLGLYSGVWGARSAAHELELARAGVSLVITDSPNRHPLFGARAESVLP
jgi:glycerophosphoryl diester phosphodiesterase